MTYDPHPIDSRATFGWLISCAGFQSVARAPCWLARLLLSINVFDVGDYTAAVIPNDKP